MSGFINLDKCFETCAVTLLKCFTIQLWQYGLPCKVPLLTAPTIPSLWRISNPYEWTLDWDGRQIVRPSSTISGTQLVTKLCCFFLKLHTMKTSRKKSPFMRPGFFFFSQGFGLLEIFYVCSCKWSVMERNYVIRCCIIAIYKPQESI